MSADVRICVSQSLVSEEAVGDYCSLAELSESDVTTLARMQIIRFFYDHRLVHLAHVYNQRPP